MIADMRARDARNAAAGVAQPSSGSGHPNYVGSSSEDGADVEMDLGIALKRSVSNGEKRKEPPLSTKLQSKEKGKQRATTTSDLDDSAARRKPSKGKEPQRRKRDDSSEDSDPAPAQTPRLRLGV